MTYSTEIQSFKANVTEAESKLQRLQEKLDEVEGQKKELNTAIAEAQRVIQVKTESNSSEVARLKCKLLHQNCSACILTSRSRA